MDGEGGGDGRCEVISLRQNRTELAMWGQACTMENGGGCLHVWMPAHDPAGGNNVSSVHPHIEMHTYAHRASSCGRETARNTG